MRNILGLSKLDVFSMWERVCDEHRQLARRGTDGSHDQHSCPGQNLQLVVVPAQPMAAGRAAGPRAANHSALAEEDSWAQLSNIVLGLRTDFLIPLPQSPCRYWGRPAPLDRIQSSQGLSAGTQPSLLWYQPLYFVSSLSLWQTFPPSWAECYGAAPHLS